MGVRVPLGVLRGSLLQGVLERKWNVENFILLLLNDKTLTHVCEQAACSALNKIHFD